MWMPFHHAIHLSSAIFRYPSIHSQPVECTVSFSTLLLTFCPDETHTDTKPLRRVNTTAAVAVVVVATWGTCTFRSNTTVWIHWNQICCSLSISIDFKLFYIAMFALLAHPYPQFAPYLRRTVLGTRFIYYLYGSLIVYQHFKVIEQCHLIA